MENNPTEKKVKPASKSSAHASLRVRKETRKRVVADLAKVNRKDFGKKIRTDQYIELAISLVTPEHLVQLQEGSLSNVDRFERDYKAYVAKHGSISKDEYLGKRLSGEIGQVTEEKNPEKAA